MENLKHFRFSILCKIDIKKFFNFNLLKIHEYQIQKVVGIFALGIAIKEL